MLFKVDAGIGSTGRSHECCIRSTPAAISRRRLSTGGMRLDDQSGLMALFHDRPLDFGRKCDELFIVMPTQSIFEKNQFFRFQCSCELWFVPRRGSQEIFTDALLPSVIDSPGKLGVKISALVAKVA